MDKEPKLNINPVEREKSEVKLEFQYKDMFGRLFGTFELEKLYPLPDPSSNEATYFDGSVETPYGNFMLECKIPEAKETLALISDFIGTKEEAADLEERFKQAESRLDAAQERYRSRGDEPDYEASRLVEDLRRQKLQLEAKSKVHEEWLKKYKPFRSLN